MPRKPTTKPKRVFKSKRRAPVRRRRTLTNVPEMASLSETRTVTGAGGNFINTMYNAMNTNLAAFTRAPLVAAAYQQYRITNIKIRVKSSADSYVSGNTASFQKPYLYHMLDKAGTIPSNVSLEQLKQMGAKPRPLDEKSLLISWAPCVMSALATSPVAVAGAKPLRTPWLSTSQNITGTFLPSAVPHFGVYWYVAAAANGAPPPFFYDVDIEVQFQFRKPLIARGPNGPQSIPVTLAIENDSSDGIVGGVDGV